MSTRGSSGSGTARGSFIHADPGLTRAVAGRRIRQSQRVFPTTPIAPKGRSRLSAEVRSRVEGHSVILRIGSALVAFGAAYGVAIGSAYLLLVAAAQVQNIGLFMQYALLAGGLSFLASLLICGAGRPKSLLPVSAALAVGLIVLEVSKVLAPRGTAGTIFRYFVFFTHLPGSAAFGVLVSMAFYRWSNESFD